MDRNDPESLLHKAQALGEAIKEIESIDMPRAFQRIRIKRKKEQRAKLYNKFLRYAAFLTLPLMLASLTLAFLHFRQPLVNEQYAEVTAVMGSVIRYELPDHSVVWLNAGSSLRYPTTFKDEHRNVELKGEAYFEVQADRKRPFYVNTPGGLTVYVYGTRFNVSAYAEDDHIETVLEKGRVNVITPNRENIVLLPGEQLHYDKHNGELLKNKVDVYEKVAWKDGKLIFRNAVLEDIFKRLERHFNVAIQFNNKSGKEYKYRATFRDENLTQIMDYLTKSAALKWRVEEAVQQADETFTKKKIIVDLY